MPLPYRRLPLCKRMSGRTIKVYGSADHFNTLEHSRHCLQALCFLPRQQLAARHVVSNPPTTALDRLGLRQAAAAHGIMTALHDLHVTPQQRSQADLRSNPPARLERPRGCSRYFKERLPVYWQGCTRGIVLRMFSPQKSTQRSPPRPGKGSPKDQRLAGIPEFNTIVDMDRVIEASRATPTPAVVTPKEPVHARCP